MKRNKSLTIDDHIIINRVEEDQARDEADSHGYRKNRKTWDELYRAIEIKEDDEPFNVQVPLLKIAMKGLKARIMSLLKKRRTFRPTEENDVEKVKDNEDLFEWIRNSHMQDYFDFLDQACSILIGEGTCIARTTWEKITGRCIEFKYYPLYMRAQDETRGIEENTVSLPGMRELTQDDIIRDILPEVVGGRVRIEEVRDVGEDRVKVKYQQHISNKQGKEQWEDQELEIDFSVNEAAGQIVARVEKPEIRFEGAVIEAENFDSVFFPVDAKDLQTCDHVIVEFTTTLNELLRKRDQGIYEFDDTDLDVIKASSIGARIVSPGGTESKEKDIEGTVQADAPEKAYVIKGYECYYLWDIEGNGYQEQVIFTVLMDARRVIRKKHLSEVFRHGRRPLEAGIWELRKHRLLGIGMPEEMESLQRLVNDVLNLIMNASVQAITPPIFYDPAMANGKNETIEYKPGQMIPIPGGAITPLPFPGNFPVGFELLKLFMDLFQREAATSDQIQGQQGGVKTATATMKLIEEAYQNMSLNIMRVIDFVKRVDRQIWKLYMAYMPENIKYRVQGAGNKWEFKEMRREDLLLNPDINLEVEVAEISREYTQQVAREVFGMVSGNAMMMQMGIVDPRRIYYACKGLLEAYGVKDYQNYLIEPDEIKSEDPENENYLMVEGQDVVPAVVDDDAAHISTHMGFTQGDGVRLIPPGMFTEVMQRFTAHIALHQQAQMMKAQQQQAAMQQAMMMNAEQQGKGGGQSKGQRPGQQDPNLQGKVTGRVNPGEMSPFQTVPMPGMGPI
jgi:hypothetical protein